MGEESNGELYALTSSGMVLGEFNSVYEAADVQRFLNQNKADDRGACYRVERCD